jgi:hypothetical protein
MMRTLTTVILATCLICSRFAFAQATGGERASTPPPVDAHAAAVDARAAGHAGQPVLSRGAGWAGVMMIVILLGFFLPAAVIGPIARALAPDEEPETHAHDEHGGSHDHPTAAHAPHAHHH